MQSSHIHQLTDFNDHELQSIMALFLTNPELYYDHKSQTDKQGYFFYKFQKFAADYYHFENNPDASVYFMSMRKERAGEFDACGGAGRMSNSVARYFKSRHAAGETARVKIIDDFSKKYRVTFNQKGVEDPRLFVGVTEIWNKLDHAEEIVAKSKWADVRSKSYCDATFTCPFSDKLDKHLVPFSIRNRALQKHKNAQIAKSNQIYLKSAKEEPKPLHPVSSSTVTFVRPAECDDEDWI